jgi:hypothetical protein
MRQVTITADERKYGIYADKWESLGMSPEGEIISGLRNYAKIWNEPHPPTLRIVGKERERKAKEPQDPKNIISLGIKPKTTEITLDIENELYEELSEIAKKQGMTNAEEVVADMAQAYIDDMNETPCETEHILLKAIFGITLRPKLVK